MLHVHLSISKIISTQVGKVIHKWTHFLTQFLKDQVAMFHKDEYSDKLFNL